MFENDFPFKIEFIASSDTVEVDATETFRAKVTWAYESDNDELDTQWGNDAYYYKEDNPDTPSISLTVIVRVKQKADS